MTRLSQIQPDDWDPELRQMMRPETRTPLENGLMRYFAHRPELAKGMIAFSGQLKRHRQLDSKLVELVRLRIAFHNQCRSCMAIRYTDAIDAGHPHVRALEMRDLEWRTYCPTAERIELHAPHVVAAATAAVATSS